jgi:hypothetical protein
MVRRHRTTSSWSSSQERSGQATRSAAHPRHQAHGGPLQRGPRVYFSASTTREHPDRGRQPPRARSSGEAGGPPLRGGCPGARPRNGRPRRRSRTVTRSKKGWSRSTSASGPAPIHRRTPTATPATCSTPSSAARCPPASSERAREARARLLDLLGPHLVLGRGAAQRLRGTSLDSAPGDPPDPRGDPAPAQRPLGRRTCGGRRTTSRAASCSLEARSMNHLARQERSTSAGSSRSRRSSAGSRRWEGADVQRVAADVFDGRLAASVLGNLRGWRPQDRELSGVSSASSPRAAVATPPSSKGGARAARCRAGVPAARRAPGVGGGGPPLSTPSLSPRAWRPRPQRLGFSARWGVPSPSPGARSGPRSSTAASSRPGRPSRRRDGRSAGSPSARWPSPRRGVPPRVRGLRRGRLLGHATDLSHLGQASSSLPRLRAVLVESNYDPAMLRDGPCPGPSERILGSPRPPLQRRHGRLGRAWEACRHVVLATSGRTITRTSRSGAEEALGGPAA